MRSQLKRELIGISQQRRRPGRLEKTVPDRYVQIENRESRQTSLHSCFLYAESIERWTKPHRDLEWLPPADDATPDRSRQMHRELLRLIWDDARSEDETTGHIRRLFESMTPTERWFMHRSERRYGTYYGIGPFSFVEEGYVAKFSPLLRQALGPYLIQMPLMADSLIGCSNTLKLHAGATVLGASTLSLQGCTVIDCGAGDGVQSLAALALGAQQVVLIENQTDDLTRAKWNLACNQSTVENERYRLLHRNLAAQKLLRRDVRRIRGDVVLISNIGDWDEYGRTNNTTALKIAKMLHPRRATLRGAVLGGYVWDSPVHRPDQDLEVARSFGLARTTVRTQVGVCESWVCAKP